MSRQLNHIEKCFGRLYCKVENMRCIGKDTTKEEQLLDLLYIAYWVSCGSDCDIDCFLIKNCANCQPTKNYLPPAPPAPACCGITAYNYINAFNISPALFQNIQVTGDPTEYSIDLAGLIIDVASSSDFVNTGEGINGVSLGILDFDGNYIYTLFNAQDGIPPVINLIVPIDGAVTTLTMYITIRAINEEGLISVTNARIDITNLNSTPVITIEGMNGFGFNNTDCNNPSFSIKNNIPITIDSYGILIGETTYPNRLTLATDGPMQTAFAFPENDSLLVGQFLANCSGTQYSNVSFEFVCPDVIEFAQFYNYGYEPGDSLVLEVSSDNIVWTVFYEYPLSNIFNLSKLDVDWDKDLFPEGETVFVRMRMQEQGVVYETTVDVPECDACGGASITFDSATPNCSESIDVCFSLFSSNSTLQYNISFWFQLTSLNPDTDEWMQIGQCANWDVIGETNCITYGVGTQAFPVWPENGDYRMKAVCCANDETIEQTNPDFTFTVNCP